MECSACKKKAVYQHPDYCKQHFIEYFDKKVLETIKKYDLVSKGQKICVATSGGKDSLTILHIMNNYFGNVTALAVDEGISDYREHTLADLKKFCEERNIPLMIKSYEEVLGKKLDDIVPNISGSPCASCGTARRYLLNKFSKGFDVIATGHNMDDEAQAVMMNLLKNNNGIMKRQNIKTSQRDGFTIKIKPLYFMKEKEIRAYALLQGWQVSFTECPYIQESFRHDVQEALNHNPELKEGLVRFNLKIKEENESKKKTAYCKQCNEPSTHEVCNFCRLKTKTKCMM